MILQRLKHVNYNLATLLKMNNTYLTGLKLKNSLTNELVSILLYLGGVRSNGRQKC